MTRSYHDRGQMFGTDGHITWTEPELFSMVESLEQFTPAPEPEYHDETKESWTRFADETEAMF